MQKTTILEPERPARKRLFFALWPDPQVRRELHRQQTRLVHGGRPVARDNLHLTLVFMGALTAVEQDQAEAAAASVTGRSFEVVLDRSGRWRNGIQWLAPGHPPAELIALQSCLNNALRERGFAPEERPFRPHVTLARRAPAGATGTEPVPLSWFIDRFALVQSRTGDSGPEYAVLREWLLER